MTGKGYIKVGKKGVKIAVPNIKITSKSNSFAVFRQGLPRLHILDFLQLLAEDALQIGEFSAQSLYFLLSFNQFFSFSTKLTIIGQSYISYQRLPLGNAGIYLSMQSL